MIRHRQTRVMEVQPGDRGKRRSSRGRPGVVLAVAVAVLYVGGVWAAVEAGCLPRYAPYVYALMSIVTYLVYRRDKDAAQGDTWRTSERKLHLLETLGGWPGALVAQWHLRHKNRKLPYQFVFWLIVILHLGTFAMLVKSQWTSESNPGGSKRMQIWDYQPYH